VAIKELNEEQVRTWTVEQKDRWWLTEVFRGFFVPQLTIRAALAGMLLGGILSLTNLYVGAKTGWTLGVGITSVILAFATFKVLTAIGRIVAGVPGLGWLTALTSEYSILENNAMQSIATAAGYMTSPLISSLAAYMMVTGTVIPMYQTMLWMAVLAILGVLFAFPFKRRFINDEQQPFPEGRAAGVVMDALHHGEGKSGLVKAILLVLFAGFAAFVKFFQSEAILTYLKAPFLTIPEFLDTWLGNPKYVAWEPKILGTSFKSLTLRPEIDLPMVGAGGLMDVRTGFSLVLGALINYALLAPLLIQRGDIVANARGTIGFREITFWSLWGGVAMMTTASLVTFFAKPKMIIDSFAKMFRRRKPAAEVTTQPAPATGERIVPDQTGYTGPGQVTTLPAGTLAAAPQDTTATMARVELPLWVSAVGIPLLGAVVVGMSWAFFGVNPLLGVVAVVLVFGFCLIAINSTGLTSITPIGAMGKLTQLIFGVLAPGNKVANLITASITGEVASHSANLLSDIKPGYMLGAKPRQQAMGHVLGVIAGAILSVPVFYLVFLKMPPAALTATHLETEYKVNAETYPMPAATVWKAVADVLTQGVENIPHSARLAALVGIGLGLLLEIGRLRTKGKFPLSPVGLGLGCIIPFHTCLSMFLGSFAFWVLGKLFVDKESSVNRFVVQNQEPICAGLIAGGALMGIAVAVAELFIPAPGGH
jgi:OPT family oligopeptide transporter